MDDVCKEERRSYALDMLRYMRISGFELVRTGVKINTLAQVSKSIYTYVHVYVAIYIYVHVCVIVESHALYDNSVCIILPPVQAEQYVPGEVLTAIL